MTSTPGRYIYSYFPPISPTSRFRPRVPLREDLFLPQELIDKILDELQRPEDLKRCALVSRFWTPRCQRHIFRHIAISLNHYSADKAIRQLKDLLQKSPYIAAYVQELVIREDDYESLDYPIEEDDYDPDGYEEDDYEPDDYEDHYDDNETEGQPGQSGRDDEGKDKGHNDLSKENDIRKEDIKPTFLEVLAAIVPLLPCLQKFFFVCFNDWPELDLELVQVVRLFPRLPHMKHVEVAGWKFPTLSSFQELMGNNLGTISTLTFHIDIREFPSSLTPSPSQSCTKQGAPYVLDALDLNVDYQAIDAWIGSLPRPMIVRRLTLRGISDPSSLMTRLSQGIEELSIYGYLEDQPYLDLSRASNLTKIAFCLSLPETLFFSDSLQTLPKDNRVKTIRLKDVHPDYLLDSAGWFQALDSCLASSKFPHLTKIDISFTSGRPASRLASFIRTNMPSTLAKNIIWLRYTYEGAAIQLPSAPA